MEEKAEKLLDFLSTIEPLKYITRHSWCSNGRQESVAEHEWRMAIMAVLLEDEFPDIDMKKVLEMCLLHDLGETDGDIPAFEKTEDDDSHEFTQLKKLTQILPPNLGSKIISLQKEFNTRETPEAKLANALDKLEALIQHNDADISTWANLEYELNLTYGQNQTDYHPFLKILRQLVKRTTVNKIQLEMKTQGSNKANSADAKKRAAD
ncbi:MAG: HD domain-containing protein [Desulfobacteraceae bacterium]|nr:HD domain-containing protein [Desulfobacteraceae bacterium]